MAIDLLTYGEDTYSRYNGMGWFIDLPRDQQELFAEAFVRLPIAIDIAVGKKLYGIVHAECPTKSWKEVEDALTGPNADGYENVAMWSRDKFNYKDKSFVDGVELIYVGHTPLKEVQVLGNVIYVDTGAVFNGKLTILEIY